MCDIVTTPVCLKALYGIPDAQHNQSENALGVLGFGTYDQRDLDLYFRRFASWIPSGTHAAAVFVNYNAAPKTFESVY